MPDASPIVEQDKNWGVIIWGFFTRKDADDYRAAIREMSPQYLSIVHEIKIEELPSSKNVR